MLKRICAIKGVIPLITAFSVAAAAIAGHGLLSNISTNEIQVEAAEEESAIIEASSKEAIMMDLTVPRDAADLPITTETQKLPQMPYSTPDWDARRKEATGFADAVSLPFKLAQDAGGKYQAKVKYSSEEEEEMRLELEREAQLNQAVGETLVKIFVKCKIIAEDGEEIYFTDCNPWLVEFADLLEQEGYSYFETYHTKYWEQYGVEVPDQNGNTEAQWATWLAANPGLPDPRSDQSYFDLVKKTETVKIIKEDGSEEEEERETEEAEVFLTDEYHEYMNLVLILFETKFDCLGVKRNWVTSEHYPMNPALLWPDRHVYLNGDPEYKDTLPVLTFGYRLKDTSYSNRFGFNLADKRGEWYQKVVVAKTATAPPTAVPTAPPTAAPTAAPTVAPTEAPASAPTDPEPTSPPSDNPTPGPDTPAPTPAPSGTKDPTEDPVNKGKAPVLGGQNDPQNNEDPKDREGQSNQGFQDPVETKPTTSAKDEEFADTNLDKTNEDKMDYKGEGDTAEETVYTSTTDGDKQESYSPGTENKKGAEFTLPD